MVNNGNFHSKGKRVSFTEADRSLQVNQGLIPDKINEDVAPTQPASAPQPLSDLTPIRSVGPKYLMPQVLGIVCRPLPIPALNQNIQNSHLLTCH